MDNRREKALEFIKLLVKSVQLYGMYGRDHALVKEDVDGLFAVLRGALESEEEITIGVIGDEIVFEKEPFFEMSRRIQGFIGRMKDMDAGKITFLRGVDKRELTELVGLLATAKKPSGHAAGVKGMLAAAGVTDIVVGKIGYVEEEREVASSGGMDLAREGFTGLENAAKGINDSILATKDIDAAGIRRLVGGIISNLLAQKSSFLILTSVKQHDEYSFVHNINVSIFSTLQAEALGLERAYLNDIATAGLMHDVGKIRIPGEILRKKGSLTDEEFKVIQSHPVYGAKILLENPDLNPIAAVAAFEHHIKYDGTGYPKRAFAGKPNLATMMITVSDFYDAFRSKRFYSGERAPETTYEEMMKISGSHFHPDLLANFFKIIGVYPPGTLVELDTGEIGLVIRESAIDIKRPEVRILYDNRASAVKETVTANLLEKTSTSGGYKRTIVRSITPGEKFKMPGEYA